MLVECDNCGAPLHVEPGAIFVTCRYCSHSNKVAGTRTLMAMTPSDWQPPVQWDVQHRRAIQGATAGAVAATGIAGCVPAVFGVVGVLVAIGGVVFAVLMNAPSSSGFSVPAISAPVWDGTTPFVCSGNDDLRVEGVTANLPGQVAVSVRQNCRLELVDCRITARVGVEAEGNRSVRLTRCTIQASETGALVSQNKALELSDTTVIAAEAAVEATGNGRIILHGGQLEGSPAVRTEQAARFDQRGGQVVDK